MMKWMLALTLTLTITPGVSLLSSSAQAKGTPQNHHCAKDGNTIPDKTRKECVKEGGKWEKDAPSTSKPADGEKKSLALSRGHGDR